MRRGLLKTATISFGQSLIPQDLQRAFDAAEDCDVLLAVRTALGCLTLSLLSLLSRSLGLSLGLSLLSLTLSLSLSLMRLGLSLTLT